MDLCTNHKALKRHVSEALGAFRGLRAGPAKRLQSPAAGRPWQGLGSPLLGLPGKGCPGRLAHMVSGAILGSEFRVSV